MNKLQFILLLFLTILVTNCKKGKTGGNCTYATVEKKMVATFVDGNLNGEYTVSFQQQNSTTDEVYRLTTKQMKNVLRNFDLNQFKIKSNIYNMTFEEISKGSCVPFVIKKIELN